MPYDNMEASFGKKKKQGFMVTVPAGYRPTEPCTGKVWKFKLSTADRVMVQVYDEDESKGMIMGDVVQNGREVTISFSKSCVGYPVFVKPKKIYDFYDQSHIVFQHNLGRYVCAQVYFDGTGQALADVHNTDINTVTVDLGVPKSGYLLVA